MEALIERRRKALRDAVRTYGDHPESWNRAAALAEVELGSALDLFLQAWQDVHPATGNRA